MPRIDDTTKFVCLSDKSFEKKNYSYSGAISLKPKSGMWFSYPSKTDGMVSEWHEFLCDRAPDLISKFCREDGTTNVISAELKETIIVTADEIQDAYKEVNKKIDFRSTDAEKRKYLLEAVKRKFDMPDAKYLILDIDKGGFESVFELFYANSFDTNSLALGNILKKVQEGGLFYYLNPFETSTGKMQLLEYEKIVKFIVECLCGSTNLEESELSYTDAKSFVPALYEVSRIRRNGEITNSHIDKVRSRIGSSNLPYINLRKYSSKESVMKILEQIDASQEEKEELLSKYDKDFSYDYIFESRIFHSLMKDEIFKDLTQFIDKVKKDDIFIPTVIRDFVEMHWLYTAKAPETISGTDFLKMFVEWNKNLEQFVMKERINGVPRNIASYFSGMINRSYTDYGLDLPSLVVFDTECVDVVSQKEQVLFSREQLIDGIKQNVETLSAIGKPQEKKEQKDNKREGYDI